MIPFRATNDTVLSAIDQILVDTGHAWLTGIAGKNSS